ncbi:Riboflavin transporter [Pseudovibrio sp. Ad13]|uniref:DMT family transporter n=1 Tax=unclassified Pseudovibrio TaxID=2627060 RepID=UPI000708A8AD|nr:MULTISPECIES: DMT family transporter [unclassified Pseudovibrio]KZK81144.1 Riboflavin transporter [Pseudovibrio sp. Ad13]KZL00652.1 Riboflavin transporter [Pseudovibrio sp. W74]KZL06842.1 Riboflavin transporter [Pseudovibrio sp. Ad14]KZL23909.1 Riboflavin transporter [Pseudovibrio sp. WM33]
MSSSRSSTRASAAVVGASWMVFAGAAFAITNSAMQYLTMVQGLSSTSATFWQYLISLVAMLPVIWRIGVDGLHTEQLALHIFRVFLAALGVQFWVAGLANGVPIWQAIALLMTSPFFVTIGAALFLRETASRQRWAATAVGFVGGMIILSPWDDAFQLVAFLPIIAALLWGSSILCMKKLEERESPQSVTLYLLLLLTPVNFVLAFLAPGGLAMPVGMNMWWLIILAGLLGAIAQGSLAMAYEKVDAAYLQPFDHLKLPLNVLCGFLIFGWVPPGNLWLGAALIIGASLYTVHVERKQN